MIVQVQEGCFTFKSGDQGFLSRVEANSIKETKKKCASFQLNLLLNLKRLVLIVESKTLL